MGKLVGFLRSTHNDDYASRGESSLWVDRKKPTICQEHELQDFIFKNNKWYD